MTREEAQSCIKTIELLRRLAYNIHGVMDVIDAKNCEKIIEALSREPSEDVRCSETPKSSERAAETAQADHIADTGRKVEQTAEIAQNVQNGDLIQRKDLIQHFHDYQVEWLKSHYDIELEPQLEELIVRFLHDTANSFMMEMDREKR